MTFVTLDMEGVLIPEIWIEFANIVGYDEFKITTKEEPDYEKLMRFRLEKLKEHKLSYSKVEEALSRIKPYDGAREFLDNLRSFCNVAILSDTYIEFVKAGIEEKLGNPLIFCHELVIRNNYVEDFKIRIKDQKKKTVDALHSLNYRVFAAGDSYNDISMIRAADDGGLFMSTDRIKGENKDLKTFENYDQLLGAIKEFHNKASKA